MRVNKVIKLFMHNESKIMVGKGFTEFLHYQPTWMGVTPERIEQEHLCQDPKDGELCLSRAKPEETLVEARRGSDVQIDLQTWVQGRKSDRSHVVL